MFIQTGRLCLQHKEFLPNQYKSTNNQIRQWTKDMILYFTEKEIYMANKHVKRCLASFLNKEIQIKTT